MAAAWVLPVLNLAGSALGLLKDERAKHHIDKVAKIKQELLDEDGKGYHSDDAKIEYLEKQLLIEIEAVNNEIALYTSKDS